VPFYVLAKELYPGRFHPTVSHAFIALLARRGLLSVLLTQNIDCLERAAGVPEPLIVEAHGSFASQRCIDCGAPFPDDAMRDHVARGAVPRCGDCGRLVKPDITFFGEKLPDRFFAHLDAPAAADLVLIIGTSLSVHPFAALPQRARPGVPRVLFNLECVGGLGSRPDDVLAIGECDAGIRHLADALGWRDELEALWKGVVGDDEARKQNARAAEGLREDVGDEVAKLADEVEEALKLGSDDESGEHAAKEKADAVKVGTGEPAAAAEKADLSSAPAEPAEPTKQPDDGSASVATPPDDKAETAPSGEAGGSATTAGQVKEAAGTEAPGKIKDDPARGSSSVADEAKGQEKPAL